MHSHSQSEDVHQFVVKLADQGHHCVLALVLETSGSTPCKAGSKAIMDSAGVIQGTIGGGVVEADAQRRVEETIRTGCPVVVDFNLHSQAGGGDEAICGGVMRVLLDPATRRNRDAYAAVSASRQSRQRGLLLTSIRGDVQRGVCSVSFLAEAEIPTRADFPDAETLRWVLTQEKPKRFVADSSPDGERLEVLVEPIVPAPVLLIVGGGHVGQAVAELANLVGFDIAVIDDRPAFARPARFPDGATAVCGKIAEKVAGFSLDRDTYIVIATRSHNHDAEALAACIHEPAAYIGMIGSQRKVGLVRKAFLESGRATAAEFQRVYAPIGLDIGSVTVPEIAASIVAQLIAVRRHGTAPRISLSQGMP